MVPAPKEVDFVPLIAVLPVPVLLPVLLAGPLTGLDGVQMIPPPVDVAAEELWTGRDAPPPKFVDR
jgi:hypothetical protein